MRASTLQPDVSELELVCVRQQDGAIQMELRTAGASAVCPDCHTPSRRVHSRYLRKLADLPCQGIRASRSSSSYSRDGSSVWTWLAPGASSPNGCPTRGLATIQAKMGHLPQAIDCVIDSNKEYMPGW